MNRLQDDYDPYAVEEPSDEEPALSRWAPALPPPSLRGFGPRPGFSLLQSLRLPGPCGPWAQRFGRLSRPAVACGMPSGVLVRLRSHGGGGADTGAGNADILELRVSLQKPWDRILPLPLTSSVSESKPLTLVFLIYKKEI